MPFSLTSQLPGRGCFFEYFLMFVFLFVLSKLDWPSFRSPLLFHKPWVLLMAFLFWCQVYFHSQVTSGS